MLKRCVGGLTAGTLAIILASGAVLHADTKTRKPEPRPNPIAAWKIDDVPRARWLEEEPKRNTRAQPQAKKKSHRGLAVMLVAIGGAVAGGYFGSIVQGSLCECDDQKATGAAYGALLGGAGAGLITFAILR